MAQTPFIKITTFSSLLCAAVVLLIVLGGCTGPLSIKYAPLSDPSRPVFEDSATVYVPPFEDARTKSKGPRIIGDIDSTVVDITGDRLVLEEGVGEFFAKAFRKELSASGIRVVDDEGDADYIIRGSIKSFWLHIGSRDSIRISAVLDITSRSGKTLWSGNVEERDERFAGVMGDSRKSIARYISKTLSKGIIKSLKEFGPLLTKGAPAKSTGREKTEKPDTGRIKITTEPDRTKVYIDGVYYGLTPFRMELEPGVYEVVLKLKGYRDESEKVGIRAGHTTELEVTMEKQ